jgi:chlorite dismutase
MYIDKDNPEHVEDRLHIVPGKSQYLFVYPFVKTREWYTRPAEQRQEMMDEHIRIGTKYRSVKLHTTYSFGLDDQEFVVAFETDQPSDFLDLVQELRETKASSYTLRDTPMFTCRQRTLGECLEALG